jgi:membrane protease YdiL (CAAX protease family)
MKKAITTALKILIFFFGWIVLSAVIDIPSENPAIWRLWAEVIPFAAMVVFTIIFLALEKGEVRIPIKQNIGHGFVVGTISGIFWIGLSAGILFALRQLTITDKKDIPQLWIWVLAAFINVIMQELLVRGYIYGLLKTRFSLPVAVIITTALFTLLHGGAFEAGVIPVINVITMCLFTTALYESEKTIIAPIMAHAIWNIIGSIVLGSVSLADDYPSVFSVTASSNILISGGDYKIEGSVVVTVLNILLLAVFWYRCKVKKTIA